MKFFSTLLISVLVTAGAVPVLSAFALRLKLVDLPGERKVHCRPIPRIGGLAMALGAVIPIAYWLSSQQFVTAFLLASAIIVVFGLIDDLRDLRPLWKLLGQFIAATVVVCAGGISISNLGMLLPEGELLSQTVGIPLTILAIVGVTNAINLSDGLDGLAGGISLLSLSCIGYLAFLEGDYDVGIIALAICGAIFGFLRYNTYPATIFMGDTGSQLLGFSTITLALALTQGATALSPLLPLIVLGFPVLDTLTVMTWRILQGRSPFAADKNHFHHGLIGIGLHQTESVLVIYMLQTGLVVSAYRFRFHSEWLLLGGYILFSLTVLLFFVACRQLHWQPRDSALLHLCKDRLRHLRDQTTCIRWMFRPMQFLTAITIIAMAALSRGVPGGIALGALVASGLLMLLLAGRHKRLEEGVRIVLYLLIPVVAYHSGNMQANQLGTIFAGLCKVLFPLLALANIVVSKLTKRRTGFRSTPLDFLILLVVMGMPNLPEMTRYDFRLGMAAAKTIILYFGCEVILAELRGQVRTVAKISVVALLVLASSEYLM